ncbi:S41 family peptidase [Acidicapsa acidisoli]|uniref:S41 family peptidase n=1 Tax=Acidicapsa acidisoli TaxID=1615681 RepID=UPI0021E01654|nr:S41 family peptidase [Acidicapsa acidisoli]
MSEKIYAFLIRLFPVHFRKTYGDDALQLFRDRSSAEKGLLPGLRLWLDMLADLAVSIPREYRHSEPALMRAPAAQHEDGIPGFELVETEAPPPGTFFSAAVLSMAIFAAISVLIVHGGSYRALWLRGSQPQHANEAQASNSAHRTQPPSGDGREKILSPSGPATQIASLQAGEAHPSEAASKQKALTGSALLVQASQAQTTLPNPQDATTTIAPAVTAERTRLVDAAAASIRQYYFDRGVAKQTADALQAHAARGDDSAATNGEELAEMLTRQMRDASHDMHLEMVYSRETLPEPRAEPAPENLARYRKELKENNCFFEKVEILPHNIGYLKLNSFPDISECRTAATHAMASLNHADAIIFDLRDNTGGFPEMVSFIASYLFDHPEYLFNPREMPSPQSWTRSPVFGNRLADKPVYVLTSGSTWSGAEQFCYDLKMLKRATLVGEKTRGGAHAGVFHRIDDHFGIGIPEVKAINPFGAADWEGVGVEPDVKVKAADALETAAKLATDKLQKK